MSKTLNLQPIAEMLTTEIPVQDLAASIETLVDEYVQYLLLSSDVLPMQEAATNVYYLQLLRKRLLQTQEPAQ